MAGNDKQRDERLAAALRENLRKRKAQGRQTAVVPAEAGTSAGERAD